MSNRNRPRMCACRLHSFAFWSAWIVRQTKFQFWMDINTSEWLWAGNKTNNNCHLGIIAHTRYFHLSLYVSCNKKNKWKKSHIWKSAENTQWNITQNMKKKWNTFQAQHIIVVVVIVGCRYIRTATAKFWDCCAFWLLLQLLCLCTRPDSNVLCVRALPSTNGSNTPSIGTRNGNNKTTTKTQFFWNIENEKTWKIVRRHAFLARSLHKHYGAMCVFGFGFVECCYCCYRNHTHTAVSPAAMFRLHSRSRSRTHVIFSGLRVWDVRLVGVFCLYGLHHLSHGYSPVACLVFQQASRHRPTNAVYTMCIVAHMHVWYGSLRPYVCVCVHLNERRRIVCACA